MPLKQRKRRIIRRRVPDCIKFKINDPVIVIAGKDKGSHGKIQTINKKRGTVVVEGINLVKKTKRKSQETPQGDIIEIPAPMHVSNVLYYSQKLNKGIRIGYKLKDGRKIRYNRKHKIEIDS